MGEKMTLAEVRDELRAAVRRVVEGGSMVSGLRLLSYADAIDAHLTQPAQAVDVDRGPWRWMYDGSVRGDGAYELQSADFRHDVQITVSGDFADHDDVEAYMQWLCAKLNGTAALPNANGKEG